FQGSEGVFQRQEDTPRSTWPQPRSSGLLHAVSERRPSPRHGRAPVPAIPTRKAPRFASSGAPHETGDDSPRAGRGEVEGMAKAVDPSKTVNIVARPLA